MFCTFCRDTGNIRQRPIQYGLSREILWSSFCLGAGCIGSWVFVSGICLDWRHIIEIIAACDDVYTEMKNLCVWNKASGGMGSLYRSKHELIFVYKNGRASHINNVELGANGRYRTNVWDYPGVNSFGENRDDLKLHPTVKNVQMVADVTNRGDVVLDSFLGSGTTLLACERVGRICRGIEIEPKYVDVAILRWQKLTGKNAVNVGLERTYNELLMGARNE